MREFLVLVNYLPQSSRVHSFLKWIRRKSNNGATRVACQHQHQYSYVWTTPGFFVGGGGSSASWEVSSASCLSYACNFPMCSLEVFCCASSLGFASLTSIFEIRKQINTLKLLVFDYFWGFFEGNSLWKLNDFGCFWNFSVRRSRIPVHRFGIPRIPVHRFGILESLRIPAESLEMQFVISNRIPDKNPWESLRIPVHRSRIPENPCASNFYESLGSLKTRRQESRDTVRICNPAP